MPNKYVLLVLYFVCLLVCFLFFLRMVLIYNALYVRFQISTINSAYLESAVSYFGG